MLLPVVPDVLLTLVAQRFGLRTGLLACAAAVVGATVGGLAMRALLDGLPAIHPGMVAEAEAALAAAPLPALLAGSITGVPYKIYAAIAAEAGVTAGLLALLTPLARAPRFVFAVVAAATFDRLAAGLLSRDSRTVAVLGFWIVFYAVFWSRMPG